MLSKYLHFAKELYNLNVNVVRQKMVLSRKNIDYAVLPQIVHEEARCCFVLSTGRCGTKLLTNLLGLSREITCEHSPSPELVYFSKLAYEASHENSDKFRLGIDMARYELIRDAFLRNKIYVETNCRITFFAPFLANVFKQAKFIHLVRHPGDVVRSGIRRKWYERHTADVGRIVPGDNLNNWNRMTQIEKIGWLWNETNLFIEHFKSHLENTDKITFVKAEDLFSKAETSLKIFEYLQVEPPPDKKIGRKINHPVNVQREGDFPEYNQWDSEQKEQLKKYAILSSTYNYNL